MIDQSRDNRNVELSESNSHNSEPLGDGLGWASRITGVAAHDGSSGDWWNMARRETRDWVLGTAWVYSWYDRIVDVAGAIGESERQENQKEKPAVWIMKIFISLRRLIRCGLFILFRKNHLNDRCNKSPAFRSAIADWCSNSYIRTRDFVRTGCHCRFQ